MIWPRPTIDGADDLMSGTSGSLGCSRSPSTTQVGPADGTGLYLQPQLTWPRHVRPLAQDQRRPGTLKHHRFHCKPTVRRSNHGVERLPFHPVI